MKQTEGGTAEKALSLGDTFLTSEGGIPVMISNDEQALINLNFSWLAEQKLQGDLAKIYNKIENAKAF